VAEDDPTEDPQEASVDTPTTRATATTKGRWVPGVRRPVERGVTGIRASRLVESYL